MATKQVKTTTHPKKRRRLEGALIRFHIDPDKARGDKEYKARKERELENLKRKLGVK